MGYRLLHGAIIMRLVSEVDGLVGTQVLNQEEVEDWVRPLTWGPSDESHPDLHGVKVVGIVKGDSDFD